MKTKKKIKHKAKTEEARNPEPYRLVLNKNALIAATLNLVLVGLGYTFLKQYKRAIVALMVYLFIYLLISYVSRLVPILIWLGLPVTFFFVYDAYKRGETSKDVLINFAR